MLVMENLLTVKEVAELLRYSEETVKRKLRAGEIAGYKTGNEWRVEREAVNRFLEERRNQNKPTSN